LTLRVSQQREHATAEIPMSSDFIETPIQDSNNVNATSYRQQPSSSCSL